MIRVAKYSARGPFRGRVQIYRGITGPQEWTVKVRIRNGEHLDEHEIRSREPCNLGAMQAFVMASIREMLPAGNLVDDAEMEFFIRGRR